MAGGRCSNNGITTSDITNQMKGPYTDATLAEPYREATTRRTNAERMTTKTKTADQPKATPQCINTPSAVVRAPPSKAELPTSVDATP
jgi:hypothetical protein